jgi:hypothetical protein
VQGLRWIQIGDVRIAALVTVELSNCRKENAVINCLRDGCETCLIQSCNSTNGDRFCILIAVCRKCLFTQSSYVQQIFTHIKRFKFTNHTSSELDPGLLVCFIYLPRIALRCRRDLLFKEGYSETVRLH